MMRPDGYAPGGNWSGYRCKDKLFRHQWIQNTRCFWLLALVSSAQPAIKTSALRVREQQPLETLLAFKRQPQPLGLRQAVGHHPPCAGVQAKPQVAGDDFNIFRLRV